MNFIAIATLRLMALALLGLPFLAQHAVATEPPKDVAINGVEFVLIPQGWFRYSVTTGNLGLQPANAPLFRHLRVWLDSFYLARYEARARDFSRFLNSGLEPAAMMEAQQRDTALTYAEHDPPPDTACTLSRDAAGVYGVVDNRHDMPATNVSWNVANAFARWLGFRLPTEAEWEKAARGPDPERRVWPWGDEYPDDTHAAFRLPTTCHPAPVTDYPKGRSPYGIYNLAGNVEEHVADWYNSIFDANLAEGARNPPLASVATPFPGEEPKKIGKGGRWSLDAGGLVIAERSFETPNVARIRMGVRFAVDVPTVLMHLQQGTATVLDGK